MTAVRVLDTLEPSAELSIVDGAAPNPVGMGGLRTVDGRALPLERVKVRTSIAGPCARTTVEQQFANPFDETLDVTWIFPLPSEGAIVALELKAADIVIVGECHKREEALANFEQARAEGKRAALVETEQRGVHTLSLAGLPPRSSVTVQITVVELLPLSDSRFRFQFPVTVAPRYTPGTEGGHSGFGTSPDTDAVPNASRLTPPIRLSGGTTLDLEVEIAGPISALESSLHAVKLSLDSGGIRVAPSSVTTLDRDFILEFSTADSSSVATRAYTDGKYTVAVVEPPTALNVKSLPRDAVFVVDISGSMEGPKLDAAKAALVGALHGLQDGDRFKLFAFDDRVEQFRADFVDYKDKNLSAADAWISALHSRGGTEMLEAIKQSLAGDVASGRIRTVLFITDGQSNDEARLLAAIANRRGNALFFTLGIDTAVNASLLKMLAKAGGGICELCTPTDDIDAIVAKLETRFGSPLLSDVTAKGSARPDGQTVFFGRPATLLIEGAPDTVAISGISQSSEFHSSVVPQRIDFSIGALWARERVSWLEERLTVRPFEEEAIKPEIERVALDHRIASKFTSFVCIDHSVRSHGTRRHVVQPVELPDQWDARAFGGGAPGGFAGAPSPSFAMPAPMSPPLVARARKAPVTFDAVSESMMLSESDVPMQSPRDASTASNPIRDAFKKVVTSVKALASEGSPAAPKEERREQAAPLRSTDFASVLARMQNANGSYGDNMGRSAAAMLVLVLLGNTRRKGDRRRVVAKLAEWLLARRSDSRAALALDALEAAEKSQLTVLKQDWSSLAGEGEEGAMLATLI